VFVIVAQELNQNFRYYPGGYLEVSDGIAFIMAIIFFNFFFYVELKDKNKNLEHSVSLVSHKGVRRGEVTTWRSSKKRNPTN
jgi:hypothetical protein